MGGAYDHKSPTTLVSATAALTAVDVLVVSARIWIRGSLKQSYCVDDWLAISALVCVLGISLTLFIGVAEHVLGYPTPQKRPAPGQSPLDMVNEKTMILMKIRFAVVIMSTAALGLIKLSFLFFYKRMFVYDATNFRNLRNIVINVMMVLVVLWIGGFMLAHVFGCRTHFYAHWSSPRAHVTHCLNSFTLLYSLALSEFIMDCIIILIPIPMVWKLRLPCGKKIGVAFVFFMGAIAIAASLMRFIYLGWVMKSTQMKDQRKPFTMDQNQLGTTGLFWYMIEVTIALIAVCLPPLSGARRIHPIEGIIHKMRSKLSFVFKRPKSATDSTLPVREISLEVPSSASFTKRNDWLQPTTENLSIMPVAVVKGRIFPVNTI